jgi:aryl-alcohol dehydrogenase-like predicted oxidoreductase
METRRLGRIGHRSSVVIYGAAALGEVDQDTADASVAQALEAGVNHLDVAAAYGEAELRLGPMMAGIRDRVFLATKTGLRGRDEAWRQINSSLERLQVDRVDLLQLHEVGDLTQLDLVTSDDGALQAAIRAKDEGLVGEVGITGHGSHAAATHLEALRRYPFATVLTPLNPALAREETFRTDYAALVDEVQRQDVGLMTIKAVSWRNWPGVEAGADRGEQEWSTWYQPLTRAEQVRAAVSWVLAQPEITGFASPGDVRLLAAVLDAERDRVGADEAKRTLEQVEDYSSPFLRQPA